MREFETKKPENIPPQKPPAEVARTGTQSPKQELPYRSTLEHSLGRDLSDIPCHSAPRAADQLDAHAYAHRGAVVLGDRSDLKTVAEETTHALQQMHSFDFLRAGPSGLTQPTNPAEIEADSIAQTVSTGGMAPPLTVSLGAESIARNKKKKNNKGGGRKNKYAQFSKADQNTTSSDRVDVDGLLDTVRGPKPTTSPPAALKGATDHGKDRKGKAKAGDAHREVGAAQRVFDEGTRYWDSESTYWVYVLGNKAIIVKSDGQLHSQFKNPQANTQQRVKDGKWVKH